jgi:hypothetical protein
MVYEGGVHLHPGFEIRNLINPNGTFSGIDAGTRGTYYFDAFESGRQTYIGP